jgi:hypothetical protein
MYVKADIRETIIYDSGFCMGVKLGLSHSGKSRLTVFEKRI